MQMRDKPLRGCVATVTRFLARNYRQKFGGKFLAKLDAPLIESIDAENLCLDKYAVLIERHQAPSANGSSLS